MRRLENIRCFGEKIIDFTTTGSYCKHQLLVEEDIDLSKADISKIFEENLTAMLENGFSNEEIYANTGMYIPEDGELEELEEVQVDDVVQEDVSELSKSLYEEKTDKCTPWPEC